LDEVAFPIMLAWRLHRAEALADFDPYPMVRLAASYLINHGPATPQERWEENSGYSPSTLAGNIAALIWAAGAQWEFPAREIVDGGFLELVRYGIRMGGDPLMEDSLRVIDAVLKTEFPA